MTVATYSAMWDGERGEYVIERSVEGGWQEVAATPHRTKIASTILGLGHQKVRQQARTVYYEAIGSIIS